MRPIVPAAVRWVVFVVRFSSALLTRDTRIVHHRDMNTTHTCDYCPQPAAYIVRPAGDLMRDVPAPAVRACHEHVERVL